MKKILLRFAHWVLKKYGVIPLDLKDRVLFNGTIFVIKSCVLSQDFFKTDLEIKMCDCLDVLER